MFIMRAYVLPLCLLFMFVVISMEDIRERKIQDKYNLLIFLLTGSNFLLEGPSLRLMLEHGVAALMLALPLFLTAVIKPGSFGGGDIKLCLAGGFYLTIRQSVSAIAITFFTAGICALWKIGMKKKGTLPFGPFISLGILLAWATGKL